MRRLQSKLLLTLLILLPSFAWALPSDRQKPIEIEADHAQLDEQQGITQYKGRAILTQGTLKLEGDIITFYYDDDKQLIKAVAQGKLAKYQQIQKLGETPVKARALQMEYHARSQMIYLIGKGHVWKDGDESSGDRIEYDINKNIVNISSKPTKPGAEAQPSGRIHIIIQPPGSKKKAQQQPAKPDIEPEEIVTATAENIEIVENTDSPIGSYPTAMTTTMLNIRTGPGTQYSKINTFKAGASLYLLTQQKDWVQVRGEIAGQAIIGWVSRRYISITN